MSGQKNTTFAGIFRFPWILTVELRKLANRRSHG